MREAHPWVLLTPDPSPLLAPFFPDSRDRSHSRTGTSFSGLVGAKLVAPLSVALMAPERDLSGPFFMFSYLFHPHLFRPSDRPRDPRLRASDRV